MFDRFRNHRHHLECEPAVDVIDSLDRECLDSPVGTTFDFELFTCPCRTPGPQSPPQGTSRFLPSITGIQNVYYSDTRLQICRTRAHLASVGCDSSLFFICSALITVYNIVFVTVYEPTSKMRKPQNQTGLWAWLSKRN